MPSYTALFLPLLASSATGFVAAPLSHVSARPISDITPAPRLNMAIDYNDPAVMEEFNVIQMMEYDDVVDELAQSGVTAPADMGDMDVKLMLVELRTVMKGGGSSSSASSPNTPPSSYGSKFEEYIWTKPMFKEFYERLKQGDDHNKLNVVAEVCNEGDDAKGRYMSSYPQLIQEIEEALNAKPEVTSPRVSFSGFPANMGEQGLEMTLAALGEVQDIVCNMSDDGITLMGEVTFGSVDVAKAAIDQYDGMDMGMGDKLQMVSIN